MVQIYIELNVRTMSNINYYFYIVARDYGFAPNPFYEFCTLACCKSKIRNKAQKGDWIIGLGSEQLNCRESIIFAMKVTETLTFNQYYKDKRFSLKKPYIDGSLKTMHGDNVYYQNSKNQWIQDDCHHNHENKTIRCQNIKKDTSVNRILISNYFFYFGSNSLIESNKLFSFGSKSLTESNKLFSNIKQKMKKIRDFRYKDMKKEGKELVNSLKKYEKKYGKNFIFGEPINWNKSFYKKQLNSKGK